MRIMLSVIELGIIVGERGQNEFRNEPEWRQLTVGVKGGSVVGVSAAAKPRVYKANV